MVGAGKFICRVFEFTVNLFPQVQLFMYVTLFSYVAAHVVLHGF